MAKREIPKGIPLRGQPDFSRRSEFDPKPQNTTKASFSYHQGSELSARCSFITDWLLTDCTTLYADWLLADCLHYQLLGSDAASVAGYWTHWMCKTDSHLWIDENCRPKSVVLPLSQLPTTLFKLPRLPPGVPYTFLMYIQGFLKPVWIDRVLILNLPIDKNELLGIWSLDLWLFICTKHVRG